MPTSKQSQLDCEIDLIANEAASALESIAQGQRLHEDPLQYAHHQGLRLWEGQQRVLESVANNRTTLVAAGNAVGKTFAAALLVAWWMQWKGAVAVTTASTWHQVRNQLWREVNALHARLALPGTIRQTSWALGPKWYATGVSTNEPDRFMGFHGSRVLVVIDEASGVHPEIWRAADSVATGANDRLVALGNPVRPSGPFYERFRSLQGATIRLSGEDCVRWQRQHTPLPGLVSAEWLDDRRAAWTDTSVLWRVHVEGKFPLVADTYLFPPDLVEACSAISERPPAHEADQVGVDVARFGGDRTVAYARYGSAVHELFCLEGTDHVATRRRLELFHATYGARCYVIDASGEGSGLSDELRARGLPVFRAVFGQRPVRSESCADLRTEGYFRLREQLESGLTIPDDEQLRQELAAQETEIVEQREAVVYRLLSKEKLRRRIGRSPDKADALMLASLDCPISDAGRPRFELRSSGPQRGRGAEPSRSLDLEW